MTELTPKSEASSRSTLDTASVCVLTIDTTSQEITSCNDAVAELVGRSATDVLGCSIADFLGQAVRPVATAVIEGIGAGFISSVEGTTDLLGADAPVGADCWIRALGDRRPHTAIAAAMRTEPPSPSPSEDAESGFGPLRVDPGRIVLATLDEDWRIVDLPPGSARQLAVPEPRTGATMPRLHELVHPADLSALDGPFEQRSSTEGRATFSLRLCGPDEQWVSTRVTVSTLHGDATATFGLVVWLLPTEEASSIESERVARLEEQLARIRQVVQATEGHGPPPSVDLSELTLRQREIVRRLLGGRRVDAIARDLHVSPSTVRNHLSAIFEKLGVASQSELVELLRGDAGAGPKFEPDGD